MEDAFAAAHRKFDGDSRRDQEAYDYEHQPRGGPRWPASTIRSRDTTRAAASFRRHGAAAAKPTRSACGFSWSPKSCSSAACSRLTSSTAGSSRGSDLGSHRWNSGSAPSIPSCCCSSSFTVALSVHFAQLGKRRLRHIPDAYAILMGWASCVSRPYEYHRPLRRRTVPGPWWHPDYEKPAT